MDVHDTPDMPRSLPLQPGMVITVEPGKGWVNPEVYIVYFYLHNIKCLGLSRAFLFNITVCLI